MAKNLYYEYKQWSIFWGLMLDQQKEVQKVINSYNQGGWKVVQFQWNATKEGLFKNILVLIITFCSFGFFSYWTGFSIVFEHDGNSTTTARTKRQTAAINQTPSSVSAPTKTTIDKDNLFN